MEIHRVNSITMDELFTIFDEVNTNLSSAFCHRIDIKEFTDRLLSRKLNLLQFPNTEFQEYLAAKELLRTIAPDQTFYDIAVNHSFNHIYDNWFDVLSYVVEIDSTFFIRLLTLINRQGVKMADERILKLIEVIDVKKMSKPEKEAVFLTYYQYYQQHDIFVSHTSYLDIIASLYTDLSISILSEPVSIESDNHIRYLTRIVNQMSIIIAIYKQGLLPQTLHKSWIDHLKNIIKEKTDSNLVHNALIVLADFKEQIILTELCHQLYQESTSETQEYFVTALALAEVKEAFFIKLIIEGIKKGYPEAISACMHFNDNETIISIYSHITSDKSIILNFFKSQNHIIIYDILVEQLECCFCEYFSEVKTISLSFLDFFSSKTYLEHQQVTVCHGILNIFKKHYVDITKDLLQMFTTGFALSDHISWFYPFIDQTNLDEIKKYADERKYIPNGEQLCKRILEYFYENSINKELCDLYRAVYPEIYVKQKK